MRKITLDDIDFDVDYEDILLLESALRHEIKTYGKKEFISKYTIEVQNGKYSDNSYRENLVVAVINEMCNKEKIELPEFDVKKLPKFVMGYTDFCLMKFTSKKESLILKSYNDSHICFKERGYLFKREDEKYNGTFNK